MDRTVYSGLRHRTQPADTEPNRQPMHPGKAFRMSQLHLGGRVRSDFLMHSLAEVLVFNETALAEKADRESALNGKVLPPSLIRPSHVYAMRTSSNSKWSSDWVISHMDFMGGNPDRIAKFRKEMGFFEKWDVIACGPDTFYRIKMPIRLQGSNPREWINQVLEAYISSCSTYMPQRQPPDLGQLEAEIIVRAQEMLQEFYDEHWGELVDEIHPRFPQMLYRINTLYNVQPVMPFSPKKTNELPGYSSFCAAKPCEGATYCMKLGCSRCNAHRQGKCVLLPQGHYNYDAEDPQVTIWRGFVTRPLHYLASR